MTAGQGATRVTTIRELIYWGILYIGSDILMNGYRMDIQGGAVKSRQMFKQKIISQNFILSI
jgi:hypothetical protein